MIFFWSSLFINSIKISRLVFLFIVGCSPVQNQNNNIAIFKSYQATEVFAAGYTGISEKYIDDISIEDIATEGIRGLGTIDPDLTISFSRASNNQRAINVNNKILNSEIILSFQGKEIIRKETPPSDDINKWSILTTEISVAAMRASPELRSASLESVYEAIFDGVLSNLDIFSRYFGAEEALRNRNKRDGFGGIGIRFEELNGLPVIVSVLKDTPAEMAGLLRGDSITHINGNGVKGLKKREVLGLLHGPIKTQIELTFIRPAIQKPRIISVLRAHIFPDSITQTISNGIIELTLKSFNQNTARSLSQKLEDARNLLGENMKGIILDLRGNPGGLLKQSVKVVDLLLTQGMIISTQGRHSDSLNQYEAGGRDLAVGLPVAVLLDGKSASAAEIVAAALQDRSRAVIIGTTSFGKGSVQTVIRLPNNGEIQLTWSRLVTPSGYMFHGLGIRPEICTSGLTNNSEKIIRQVINKREKILKMLTNWRKVTLNDKLKRAKLRNTCPSERRLEDLESSIAKYLITHPSIYQHALELSTDSNAANY